jgi:hypothetical protein
MAKKEEKAVATTEKPGALANAEEFNSSWGTDYDTNDVLIPRLLLMQGLSDMVQDGTANVGDIVRSLDKVVLAPRGEKLKFIPICHDKGWRIGEKVGDRFEWRRNEPWNPENANRPLAWQEKGTEWRADRTLNFFILLVDGLEKERKALEALNKGKEPSAGLHVALPCQLQFQRTSYRAA